MLLLLSLAPKHDPSASLLTAKSMEKSGICKIGAVVRAHWSSWNALTAYAVQLNPSFHYSFVNGTVMIPKFLMDW
jgi:hypothetical protein